MNDALKPGLATPHDLRCTCDRCCTGRAADAGSRAVFVRFDHPDDMGTECDSLYIASCEPPADPEARIVIKGGRKVADAHPERCEWAFTEIGLAIIALEAEGQAVAS